MNSKNILNLLQQKHAEYVDKYGTYPDLLFIGHIQSYDLYTEIIKSNSFSYQQFKFISNQEFLGCKIIRLFDPYYGYDFYEYQDLNQLADYSYSLDLEFINYQKLPLLSSEPMYSNGGDQPTGPATIPFITVPIKVIEAFKAELKFTDLYNKMKKVQATYQEWLRFHSR